MIHRLRPRFPPGQVMALTRRKNSRGRADLVLTGAPIRRYGARMLTSLEQVVGRLIDGYAPERIILFGSAATLGVREGSDIDLLIVKDTAARPIDRRMEVERLLADRRVPLDLLVYTPRELWDLYTAGSPFIEEVLETGRVLYMRKATEAWLAPPASTVNRASKKR